MTSYSLDARLQENRAAITDYWSNMTLQQLGIMLGVVAFFVAFVGYLNQHVGMWVSVGWVTNIFGDFYANVSSELVSIVITVLVLDRLQARRTERERQLALFRQAKSRSNDFAKDAIDQILHDDLWDNLREHYEDNQGRIDLDEVQWGDGIHLKEVNLEYADLIFAYLTNADLASARLKYAILYDANLENADLRDANLEHTNLHSTNLESAMLYNTNLENAMLYNTNLENADLASASLKHAILQSANLKNAVLQSAHLEKGVLGSANLENANLMFAHLEDAILQSANLKNASLWGAHFENARLWAANLQGAKHIKNAHFDERTVLPDAKRIRQNNDGTQIFDKYWTPDTDMTRYTNPEHPDFWIPPYLKRKYNRYRPEWVTDEMLVD